MEWKECYRMENTQKPRLGNKECLENHQQYICGTCGRIICIDEHPTRKLRRWNFPFKSLEVAKLYLRTADYTTKRNCGVYELINENNRKSYKIFIDDNEMRIYLKNHKDKKCTNNKAQFKAPEYKKYASTEIRKLNKIEAENYHNKKETKI